MSKHVTELNDNSLEAFLTSQSKPTVVEFWDPWCNICIEVTPIFTRLAKIFEGNAIFAKLNMKKNEESPKFQVYVTPTFILFKDGKEIKRVGGLIGDKELRETIEEALNQF